MYHCAYSNWFESTWNGMYLLIEGNTERTSSYRVVQQPAVLDPSRPADSDTLQCSLLSQPEEKTCSGEPRVFWLRAKMDKSVPDLIYTDGKTHENCEKPSNTQKRCSYNFSKKVSPSDVGTYYCAVATCGEILLGDGTRVENAHSLSDVMLLVITVICLAISMVLNIVLICCQTQRTSPKNKESSSSRPQYNDQSRPDDFTEDGEHMTYAGLHFSTGTMNRREFKTEESVYSNVRFSQSEYTT
ncbi:PREDICTED: uncharacterized protein LOC107100476 [Cyprinodon variegatus]|uniref:uncharacterized protein LOC107100476 n=1 Tax=Cyprinodon variegatus TaxID=28743 RepID=UPI0007425631|nr:PREDICTED: uncharacterized protein LOC107100476 [Cyprinodon variegatus]